MAAKAEPTMANALWGLPLEAGTAGAPSAGEGRAAGRALFLNSEKRIILAFRFVVALVAAAFLLTQPSDTRIPWQFYFAITVFLVTNLTFCFKGMQAFDTRRAQRHILAFDMGMLVVLMFFLGLTNGEFHLVFLLTIFVSALSRRAGSAFAISALMGGLYVVFTVHGMTDVALASPTFFVRMVLFFVVSSFAGHVSETAENARKGVSRLSSLKGRAERAVFEREKMAVVGLLAAGIAHEFRGLLDGMRSHAECALTGDVPMDGLPATVTEQCRRAAVLVRDLLSFSRKNGGEPGPVDAGASVEQVLRLVRNELNARGIDVQRHIAGDTAWVTAEPGAIERATLNLVTNAIAAMEGGGKLYVEVLASGGKVLLRVADNGCGMDESTLARAFDPFFSTRGSTDGVVRATGLGLPVSRSLVQRCGGTVEIVSEEGRGSVVTAILPAARAPDDGGAAGMVAAAGEVSPRERPRIEQTA